MTAAAWPLQLPHQAANRILRSTKLVLTASIKPGLYDVQDALTARRNQRRRNAGHYEDQADPTVATIHITEVDEILIIALTLQVVRACGFKTQRDFYDDWLTRRRTIDPDLPVLVCSFQHEQRDRYLHQNVGRGYTTRPGQAVIENHEEGAVVALSAQELKQIAGANHRRYERERRDEITRQRARSIHARLKTAVHAEDAREVRALRDELDRLADLIEAA